MVTIPILFTCSGLYSQSLSRSERNKEVSKVAEQDVRQQHLRINYEKYLDTRYEYADPQGKALIIENSLPKGGQTYTDLLGNEYVYAVFWTQITNETDNPLDWAIDFPAEFVRLQSSSVNYIKVVLPAEEMTIDKAPLFNYGLTDIGLALNNTIHAKSSLQSTIKPMEKSLFYVLVLSKKGVKGTIRTGLSLNQDKLVYRVNDKEWQCGQINLKNIQLRD